MDCNILGASSHVRQLPDFETENSFLQRMIRIEAKEANPIGSTVLQQYRRLRWNNTSADALASMVMWGALADYNCVEEDDIYTRFKRRLPLAHSEVRGYELIELLKAWPALEEIDLRGAIDLTETSLERIPEFSKHLKIFRFGSRCDYRQISEEVFIKIFRECAKLEEVYLSDIALTDAMLEALAQKKDLKVLDIHMCYRKRKGGGITQKHLDKITANCKELTHCSLTHSLDKSFRGTGLETLNKLQVLKLSGLQMNVTSETLVSIIKANPGLRVFSVREGKGGDAVLQALAQYCPKIKKVDIFDGKGVSSVGVGALLEKSRTLKKLNVLQCGFSKEETLSWMFMRRDVKILHAFEELDKYLPQANEKGNYEVGYNLWALLDPPVEQEECFEQVEKRRISGRGMAGELFSMAPTFYFSRM
tara:strand:- start:19714 stop:20973 length:1260 start_codon:yes stop_codon:yes gene_type:complete